jgi:uncharacterized metal-binding protein YceD (DUF177 family)
MAEVPEFSRRVDVRAIDTRVLHLEANEAERATLAARFGLVALHSLAADIELAQDGDSVDAHGTLHADFVQSCAISGDDLPVQVREPIVLRFVPESELAAEAEEEIELDPDAVDEIPYARRSFDLGEAVAQSLALAIDPYATGPEAEKVRKEAGLLDEQSTGPFAALAAFKDKKPE